MAENSNRPAAQTFQTFVMAAFLVVMIGWLLKVGQAILLPIFIAIILVYLIASTSEAMGRWPLTRILPNWLRRVLVLAAFLGAIGMLAGVAMTTLEQLIGRAPVYQRNLEQAAVRAYELIGLQQIPDWTALRAATIDRLDVRDMLAYLLTSVGSVTGMIFMVALYATFILSERDGFAQKLTRALPRGESAKQTQILIQQMNRRIGDYLAVKTFINVILGMISFVVLWFFGVDFAVFWALLIGLLNYIPYIGSLIAVLCPVLLTIAQFGSIQTTLLVAALLIAAQAWVGNLLEPRLIGHKVNLSPFVVLMALSVWSAIWGAAGAILAIPMTSAIAICLAAFPSTRPLSVLLANDEGLDGPLESLSNKSPDHPAGVSCEKASDCAR